MLGKTVFELENTMSINELREWSEYLSKEPVNSIEIQLSLLTTVVTNMMGEKKNIEDFLITQYKPRKNINVEYATEDAVMAAFMSMATTA